MANPRRKATPRKCPLDIEVAIERLRQVTAPYPKAALFELATRGHASVFEILVACLLSIRTRDEVTLPAALRLFARARTPAEVAALTVEEIEELIGTCTFHEQKAPRIHAIARRVAEEHGGTIPCDSKVLLSFHGVGPKCANLALGIACGEACIGVDVHVHRVTNRWGYVQEKTPEKTMAALQQKLPRAYWVEINALLVPFGKHVCTGHLPRCSTCPLLEMCQQVGVTSHR